MRELADMQDDLWCGRSLSREDAEQVVMELVVARGAVRAMREERDRQRHYYLQLQAQIKSLSLEVERLKRGSAAQNAVTERIAETV